MMYERTVTRPVLCSLCCCCCCSCRCCCCFCWFCCWCCCCCCHCCCGCCCISKTVRLFKSMHYDRLLQNKQKREQKTKQQSTTCRWMLFTQPMLPRRSFTWNLPLMNHLELGQDSCRSTWSIEARVVTHSQPQNITLLQSHSQDSWYSDSI